MIIQYRINEQDELIFVNDAWDIFAGENDGTGLDAVNVLQRPLFGFISDPTTRLIYRYLLQRARTGHQIAFFFRCDSPAVRRLSRMRIGLIEPGVVAFSTELLTSEPRKPISLPIDSLNETAWYLQMCAWCQRVEIEDHTWVALEEAIPRLQLFEQAALPKLTHGICIDCFESTFAAVSKIPPSRGHDNNQFKMQSDSGSTFTSFAIPPQMLFHL